MRRGGKEKWGRRVVKMKMAISSLPRVPLLSIGYKSVSKTMRVKILRLKHAVWFR